MTMNFGERCDALYELREKIAEAQSKVDALEKQKREMEDDLLAAMTEAGTDLVRGQRATASITETVVPQIADMEAFGQFVLRKKALHLFQRRIAATAYRELKESLAGKPVPGVNEFTKISLSLRKG
jgi:chromosome segregation ATPase